MYISQNSGVQTGHQDLFYCTGCGKFYANNGAAHRHGKTPGHSIAKMDLAVTLELVDGQPKARVVCPTTGRELDQ